MIRLLLLSLILLPGGFYCLGTAIRALKTGRLAFRFSGDEISRARDPKFFLLICRVLALFGVILLIAWAQIAFSAFGGAPE